MRSSLLAILLATACGPSGELGRIRNALGSDATMDLPVDGGTRDTGATSGCGAIGQVGCCDGETLWWCDTGALKSLHCGARPRCGWNAAAKYHDCNTSGGSDPSGGYAKECFLVTDAALPRSDRPVGDGGGDCRGVTAEGCCDGNTLLYCIDGVLRALHCGLNPSCGWLANAQFYDCGTEGLADPQGLHPKACPIRAPDGLAVGLRDQGSSEATVDLGALAGDAGSGDGCDCAAAPGEPPVWAFWLILVALALVARRAQVR